MGPGSPLLLGGRRELGVEVLGATMVIPAAIVALLVAGRYKVSRSDQKLVRTGPLISDVAISKNGFVLPFQKYNFISLQPATYAFELHAMSHEKLEFMLPAVFTIGPAQDEESLQKYAKLMLISNNPNSDEHVRSLVQGIIEGETRLQSAQLEIEEIFGDRRRFKDLIMKEIGEELGKFGLVVYNANIKELQDTQGSEYFSLKRQKARANAEKDAKIEVAAAVQKGTVGEKETEALTRQQVIRYEAQTITVETEQKTHMETAHADLAVTVANQTMRAEIAKTEGIMAQKSREAELQQKYEVQRAMVETERNRANKLSATLVQAEMRIKEAEGEATARNISADALLYAKQKEAEGVLAMYNARAAGLSRLLDSFGRDPQVLVQYLMLEEGLYEKLAQANATAIQGLNPKITIWNTSNGSSDDSDGFSKPISNIIKMIPPLLSAVQDQTGSNLLPGFSSSSSLLSSSTSPSPSSSPSSSSSSSSSSQKI